jgi:hypothetical protein
MSPSQFRLFLAGVITLAVLAVLGWWGLRELAIHDAVVKCMGGYEILRDGCIYSARKHL